MKYIPLRVKTSYSLLKSMNDIHKLILYCKENDINTICICDENMYGVMEFYKECIKNNIKPVIGLELNIDNNIVLLYAKNYLGYQNLTRIVYEKQEKDINVEVLNKYKDNLICVSTMNLNNIFDDFYFGYTDIEKRTNDKSVYINEILCLKDSDREYLKYLYLIKKGKKVTDDVLIPTYDNCYLDFKDYDYENSLELVNKCNIEFKQNKKLFPKYNVDNSKEYLLNLCKKGLYKRFDGKITKSYYDRLLYELDVIDAMGFNDYFLVVWDYVKFCRQNDILIGSGRGSAAGSLVSYSLGITDVDPLKYNLLFERFLNKERITMPDIDIDFDSERRDEVVKYVIDKYGKKRVVPIITFSTLSAKQVIRDVSRIFDISLPIVDSLTKLMDNNMTLTESLKNSNVKSFLEKNYKMKEIYKIALKLEGLKRQISTHAAGVIIGGDDLTSYIPLQKYEDYYISGYSMEHLEELGLIKMDFLSLKNLNMVKNIIEEIGNIKYKDIPIDDISSIALFKDGNTSGIFQFESTGMKRFLERLKPSNFDDIVAAIALYRPGPSDNIDTYIKRKNGKEKITYLDNSLMDILKPTYGIIIYQEQIMEIANKMAGYSFGEADILRRAMSKKKKEVMLEEKERFIKRSIERGHNENAARKVYDYILKFADYGFNKAHSVGYSMLAMKMAYLKSHYKEEFMSSLLTNAIGNEDKIKEYIEECKKMNINILKPDINESEYSFKKSDCGILYSLSAIKNVGVITSKEIILERENGLFKDFFDFVKRMYGKSINKKIIESLIDSGAFNSFGYNHKTLYNNIDSAINYAFLSKDLDESLVEVPKMLESEEFTNEELSKSEKDVFGFYLENHPVVSFKLKYDNVINTIDIPKYFDKKVNLVLVIDRINRLKTKNNDYMAFISGSDEFGIAEITVFPNKYDLINDLDKKNIILVTGLVEKRMSKYQVVLDNLIKL